MNTILLIIAIALMVWIIGTILVVQWVEEPEYTIIEKRDGYEIREYRSYIVAEVDVQGNLKKSMNAGFRQLAGYIFGGNTTKTSVKMTIPVMDTSDSSESIKMTAPVMDTSSRQGSHTVAFTMPSTYTLDSLPKPNNANIRFRTVEPTKMAVLGYTLYVTEGRLAAKKKLLLSLLTRDAVNPKGEMISAQYNPPMSFPLLRRNEVMVEIE